MLPDRSITEPQRRALEAVRDGEVRHSGTAMYAYGYSPWSHPPEVRRQTIQRVIDKGLARVGPHKKPTYMADVELTEAGRIALDEEQKRG